MISWTPHFGHPTDDVNSTCNFYGSMLQNTQIDDFKLNLIFYVGMVYYVINYCWCYEWLFFMNVILWNILFIDFYVINFIYLVLKKSNFGLTKYIENINSLAIFFVFVPPFHFQTLKRFLIFKKWDMIFCLGISFSLY